MFARYIYHRCRQLLKEEYEYYNLQRQNPTCKLVRPYHIVNSHLLHLGSNVGIRRNCYLHCGGYDWSNGKGRIVIGSNTWIGENNVLYGAGEIEIGENSVTGPNTLIFSSRDNYAKAFSKELEKIHQFAKVVIGDHVIIFSNVVLTPGVTIGEGAVIGAGSLVTKDIPPWSVAMGAPAKVVKPRDKDFPIEERHLIRFRDHKS